MLAREAIVEQMPLAEARGVDLGLLAGENNLFVTGETGALRILLANLLTNALRHAPPGGWIDVTCHYEESQTAEEKTAEKSASTNPYGEAALRAAVLEVADNGPGRKIGRASCRERV